MFHEKLSREQKAVALAIRHRAKYNKCHSPLPADIDADQDRAKRRHACVHVYPEFKNGDDYLNMIVVELSIQGILTPDDLYHKPIIDALGVKFDTHGLMNDSYMFQVPADNHDD